MEESFKKRVCNLLQVVAEEGEARTNSSNALPEHVVLELYSIFNSSQASASCQGVLSPDLASSTRDSSFTDFTYARRLTSEAGPSSSGEGGITDGSLWEELAENRVSLQSVVAGLRKGLEMRENPRKGSKKGKRVKGQGRARDTPDDDRQEDEATNVQEILPILTSLQAILGILHLKDHQDSLKALVGLLVEVPLLFPDRGEEESRLRGLPRKAPCSNSASLSLSFGMLQALLAPVHGDPLATTVLILKALAPSILLSHGEGSLHQRIQMKAAALHFSTQQLLGSGSTTSREAVIALSRYLCFKAPEKAEARQHAVDSVMELLRALTSREWFYFTQFLANFSRSKASRRLFSVDLALALLVGLPDPFKEPRPSERLNQDQDSDRRGGSVVSLQGEAEHGVDREPIGGPQVDNSRQGTNGGTTGGKSKQWEVNGSVNEGWEGMCVEIIYDRCSDKAPVVRARSLSNLAQVLEVLAEDRQHHAQLQRLLGFGAVSPSALTSHQEMLTLERSTSHRDMQSLMQQRCLDEKAMVRKAALILMKKSTSLLGTPDDSIVAAMGAACGDAMVSIRKAALAALSEVVRKFPGDTGAASEWLKSALPLALDNEVGLQEECLDLFEELVVKRVAMLPPLQLPGSKAKSGQTAIGKTSPKNPQNAGGEELTRGVSIGVLAMLKGMADEGTIASAVKRACGSLGRKGRLRPEIALALQDLISTVEQGPSEEGLLTSFPEAPHGAWFLLSEVSAFVPKAVGWEFLRKHWQILGNEGHGRQVNTDHTNRDHPTQEAPCIGAPRGESAAWAADRVHLLRTIANMAMELPCDAAADLAEELLNRLNSFSMHTAEVWAHVEALTTLSKQKALSKAEGEQLVTIWVSQLLDKAGTLLHAYVATIGFHHVQPMPKTTDFQTPYVTTGPKIRAGKENQLPTCHKGSSTRSQRKMETSARLPDSEKNEAGSRSGSACFSDQIITVIFTVGALAVVCPTAKPGSLVTLLQALVAPKKFLPGKGNCNSETEGGRLMLGKMLPDVCIQAWVALSKLCLADETLAKRCMPFFIQELERSELAAVRNNIMQAMTDFFVRYPTLVDGYIHNLTKVLRDTCELVRRQAFILLARLLQKDYVKWRGVLFHRFLLALVDDSPKICELANFLFKSILKTKSPLLAYNSFVEAIFVLNDCRSHSGFCTALSTSESERKLFSLRGNQEGMASKRMQIYTALLQQMAPEHLLATSAKLCAEILAGAADGLLDLNDINAQGVLQDALRILASKEVRVTGNRASTAGAELEEDEGGGAAAAVAAAKGRMVTRLMKRNLVQNAIPIFIELKRLLESKNSPLLGLLMESMRVMLKEYKNEMDEILMADKQLHKELLYDIQKHEASKARAKVAAGAMTPGSVAPAHHSQSRAQARAGSASGHRVNLEVVPPSEAPPSGPHAPQGVSLERSFEDCVGTCGNGALNRTTVWAPPKEKENCKPLVAEIFSGLRNSTLMSEGVPNRPIKRKAGLTSTDLAPAASPRVTWLDSTPGYRNPGVMRAPASIQRTPVTSLTRGFPHFTPAAPSLRGTEPSLRCGNHESQRLAGAVADVAAAATVAAVLREVATGSATPLRGMSLPRLRPRVPSLQNVAPGLFPSEYEGTPAQLPTPLLDGSDGREPLEPVRRRQSFSSIALGLPR